MFTLMPEAFSALTEEGSQYRPFFRIVRVLGLVVVFGWPPMQEFPGTGVGLIQAAPMPDKGPRLKGRYLREDYGFAIDIPSVVIAFGPNCDADGVCGSTHGFSGTLSIDKKAEIYLFPEYSPAIGHPPTLARSNREVLEYVMSSSHPNGTQVFVSSTTEATLATLPALRVVAKFREPTSPTATTVDVIFALRMVSATETILYRIGLATPSANYERDKGALEMLVASFRIIPLP